MMKKAAGDKLTGDIEAKIKAEEARQRAVVEGRKERNEKARREAEEKERREREERER